MDVTQILGICLFVLIFLVGVPGNLLIIWLFYRKPRKRSTSWLIISLASIDLAACLIAPINLIRTLGGKFIITATCRISIFGSRLFSFSALYLTICIALDRYRSICRPLKQRLTSHRLVVAILLCVLLAFCGNIQYVLYVRTFQVGEVKKCIYRDGPHWLLVSNDIFTSVTYLTALAVCSAAYIKIYLTIRKQMKVRVALGSGGSGSVLYPQIHRSDRKTQHPCQSSTINSVSNEPNGMPSPPEQVVFQEPADGRPQNALCSDLLANGATCGDINAPSVRPLGNLEGSKLEALVATRRPIAPDPPVSEVYPVLSTLQMSIFDNNNTTSTGLAGANAARERNAYRRRKERLMTRMLLGTNLILVLTWLPSFILTNVPDAQLAAFRSKLSQSVVVYVSYQLRTLNHIVSIFVFALLNENFRRDCKKFVVRFSQARQM